MSNTLEPNFNGLPKPTDWKSVIVPLQQANEKEFRGATLLELGDNLNIEMSINAQRVPAVPTGALVAGPADREVFMEIKEPGSWTWGTNPPLTNAQGNIATFYWDKTDWKKNDSAALPVATGVDVMNPVGDALPKEKAVADYARKISVLNENLKIQNLSKNIVDISSAIGGKVVNSNLNGNGVNPINVTPSLSEWRTIFITLDELNDNNTHLLVQNWNSVRNDIYWGKGVFPNISTLTIAQGLSQLVTSGSLSNLGLPGKDAGKIKLERPSSATWFAINVKNNTEAASVFSSLMISYGKADSAFPEYSPGNKKIVEINGIPLIGADALTYSSLTIDSSKNKFNKELVHNGYIRDDGYVGSGGSTYAYTDPIDVSKMPHNLFLSSAGTGANTGYRYITAYDKSGKIMVDKGANSGANTLANVYNKDASVFFIVVSLYISNINTFQIEEGDKRTEYEPYRKGISGIDGIPLLTLPVSTSLINIIAEGDSTTEGADLQSPLTERWSTLLQAAIGSSFNIINRGTSGGRAEEIVARIGGNWPKIKIAGGILSPGVRASLTYLDIEPLRSGSSGTTFSYPCAIYDYNGIIAHGYMTKTNSSNGFVSTENISKPVDPTKEYYLVSTANKELSSSGSKLDKLKDVFILGMGANNISLIGSGEQTIGYLKQQWTNAFTAYPNLMAWGQTDRGLSELTIINEIEDFLIEKYGNKFCPVRQYLASNQALVDAVKIQADFVPTQTDLDRVAAGSIPPSFKSSSGSAHLNALGHILQMNFMKNWLQAYFI